MGKKTEFKRVTGRQKKRRSSNIRREREISRRLTNQRATVKRENWSKPRKPGSWKQRTAHVKHGWLYGMKRGVWWKRKPGNERGRGEQMKKSRNQHKRLLRSQSRGRRRARERQVGDGKARSITNFSAEPQSDCFPISPGHNELAWIAVLQLLLLSLTLFIHPPSLYPPHVSQGPGACNGWIDPLHTHKHTHTNSRIQAWVLQQDAKTYHCHSCSLACWLSVCVCDCAL